MINTSKKTKTILVHGPSGSGKDTQVDLLLEKFDFEKIVTGDMLREAAETDSELADLMNSGNFPSSVLTYKLLNDWIKKYDVQKGWVFVSVVRKFDQIELFDRLLKKYGRELDTFIHFSLSAEKAIERMSLRKVCVVCGENYHDKYKPEKVKDVCDKDGGKLRRRDDDKPEAIEKRLQEYDKTIEPILKEYESRGVLIDIDASFTIEEIHKVVLEKLRF